MKTVKKSNKRKVPLVTIDESSAKYKDKITCPEKLCKVNGMIKTDRLPENKRRR